MAGRKDEALSTAVTAQSIIDDPTQIAGAIQPGSIIGIASISAKVAVVIVCVLMLEKIRP